MFTPSKFQSDIFTAAVPGAGYFKGDIRISAVAGSGKTTTLIELLNRVPAATVSSTLLCAFNRDIKAELERRAPEGTVTKTFHAIGLKAISDHHLATTGRKFTAKTDARKYNTLVRRWFTTYVSERFDPETEGEKAMMPLVNFCRLTLTDPTNREAVLAMAADRELDLPEPEIMLRALPVILEWGIKGARPADPKTGFSGAWTEVIDFTDMIYLPFVFDAEPQKFALVLVDESQDLNAAQLQLVLRCRKEGGQMIFVGDPHQAIYGFAGADHASWQKIGEVTGAREMPLSVCYRCPKSVLALAQEIVPHIEPAPNAPEGTVDWIKEATFETMVENRDMILCRTNAPLISWAFRLIGAGKPAKVRGRDIGASLVKTLDAIEMLDGFTFSEFYNYAQVYRMNQVRVLQSKDATEMQIEAVHDRVDSLIAVHTAAVERGAIALGEVRAYVNDLFTDEENGHILLSSVHKAKGLEAERVFILHPEQMPHPMARTKAAQEQEMNLKYVAITRALRELYFVRPEKRA